ncbi:MAG: OmpA family protein [Rhodospirillales bacterium]|nr:OmpA family protein [Rhodospirillales bacterium]
MAVITEADAFSARKSKRNRGAPMWLMTFADLMTLLFALFVMINSFSEVDSDSFRRNAGPMAEAFNQPPPTFTRLKEKSSSANKPKPKEAEAPKEPPPPAANATYLQVQQRNRLTSLVDTSLKQELASSTVEMEVKDTYLILRFPAKTTFALGSAELSAGIVSAIDRVSDILARTSGNISVSGHTDNQPISTARFRSNWELSAARAVTVVHRLLRHRGLAPTRVSAVGYADTRPRASNDTAEGRANNRRVEMKVEIPAVR